VRLGFFEDGMEAAEVGPFVGVKGEDSEQRSHGLSVIPRKRHPGRCTGKGAKHSFPWIAS
jgi:hypothetical protein